MDALDDTGIVEENTNVWILKYCPLLGTPPLFLLCYTDTDEENTDKLFTHKTGKILATNSNLNEILKTP